MSPIFEMPSTLCDKEFKWHEIFAVLRLSSETPRNKVFQQNSQILQFLGYLQDTCK